MTDSNDTNTNWGMDAFLEQLTKWERQTDARANQMMGTELFSAWMNQMQSGQYLMQQMFSDFMNGQLAATNLPSRDDVIRLSEAVRKLDRRVEGLEQKVDELLKPAKKTATAKGKRPARTRRPAKVKAAEEQQALAARKAAEEQKVREQKVRAARKAAEAEQAEAVQQAREAEPAAAAVVQQPDVDAIASTIERIDEVLAGRAADAAAATERAQVAKATVDEVIDEPIKGAA